MIPEAAPSNLVDCPGCGTAPQPGGRLRRRAAPVPARPPAHGLSSEELLAKIDALDREVAGAVPALPGARSVAPPVVEAATVPAARSRPWLLPALAAGGLAVLLLVVLAMSGEPPPAALRLEPVTAVAVVEPSPAAADPAASLATAQAEEQRRVAKLAQAVSQAERVAERRAEERQARAREEEQRRLDQEFRERRRQAEEERRRGDGAAPEARAPLPVAAVRRPASPAEVCAGEAGFFARGLCETRICATAEWRDHPYCVTRAEEQLRRLQQGG